MSLLGVTIISLCGIYNFIRNKKVNEDEVILSWLTAEAKDPNHKYAKHYQKYIETVELDKPDLENLKENLDRRLLFNRVRGDYSLWIQIYKSTTWYKKRFFILGDMKNIYSPYPPPENERRSNRINLNGIILWGHGHTSKDKLVILEGNHRWASRKSWIPYFPCVYIGVSKQKYDLHAGTGCNKCRDE